ncbi:hypothetical protein HK099_006060 [Clydaea vesicula]|uniref:Uncharacterized protein n=1 Tax=Clydaea vesicula TaxID=447962 RepID=A0AAD5U6A5_9FUNG|nr:hypothetical protein HK099_006060 [Clydaea vesicula]
MASVSDVINHSVNSVNYVNSVNSLNFTQTTTNSEVRVTSNQRSDEVLIKDKYSSQIYLLSWIEILVATWFHAKEVNIGYLTILEDEVTEGSRLLDNYNQSFQGTSTDIHCEKLESDKKMELNIDIDMIEHSLILPYTKEFIYSGLSLDNAFLYLEEENIFCLRKSFKLFWDFDLNAIEFDLNCLSDYYTDWDVKFQTSCSIAEKLKKAGVLIFYFVYLQFHVVQYLFTNDSYYLASLMEQMNIAHESISKLKNLHNGLKENNLNPKILPTILTGQYLFEQKSDSDSTIINYWSHLELQLYEAESLFFKGLFNVYNEKVVKGGTNLMTSFNILLDIKLKIVNDMNSNLNLFNQNSLTLKFDVYNIKHRVFENFYFLMGCYFLLSIWNKSLVLSTILKSIVYIPHEPFQHWNPKLAGVKFLTIVGNGDGLRAPVSVFALTVWFSTKSSKDLTSELFHVADPIFSASFCADAYSEISNELKVDLYSSCYEKVIILDLDLISSYYNELIFSIVSITNQYYLSKRNSPVFKYCLYKVYRSIGELELSDKILFQLLHEYYDFDFESFYTTILFEYGKILLIKAQFAFSFEIFKFIWESTFFNFTEKDSAHSVQAETIALVGLILVGLKRFLNLDELRNLEVNLKRFCYVNNILSKNIFFKFSLILFMQEKKKKEVDNTLIYHILMNLNEFKSFKLKNFNDLNNCNVFDTHIELLKTCLNETIDYDIEIKEKKQLDLIIQNNLILTLITHLELENLLNFLQFNNNLSSKNSSLKKKKLEVFIKLKDTYNLLLRNIENQFFNLAKKKIFFLEYLELNHYIYVKILLNFILLKKIEKDSEAEEKLKLKLKNYLFHKAITNENGNQKVINFKKNENFDNFDLSCLWEEYNLII